MKTNIWIVAIIALHFTSCTPDNYVQIVPRVQTDTGYVVMRHWQEIYVDRKSTV
jgi:hypothetical protein